MKIYVAIDNENGMPYFYTSKIRFLKEVKACWLEPQEPIVFKTNKMGILFAMRMISIYCGNTGVFRIGNKTLEQVFNEQ